MLALILVLALVIVGCWAIQSWLPGEGWMKNILCLLIVLAYVIWALQVLGVATGL